MMKHRLAALHLAAATLLASPAVGRAQQTLYMSMDSGTINTISSAWVVSTFATVAPGPKAFITGVALSASGNLFTVNNKTGVISRVKPTGAVSTFAVLPTDSRPAGMAFDTSGNLFVSNDESGVIDEITPAGKKSRLARLGAKPEPFGG